MLEENRETLLEYHVVPGEILAADLADGDEINAVTRQGEALMIIADDLQRGPGADGDTLTCIGVGPLDRHRAGASAVVVTHDLEARNGVVHAVDRGMVPPSIGPDVVLVDALANEAGD